MLAAAATSGLGAGIGLGIQNLVLIVQNTFPASQVGTATAANNFFREIGGSLGSAIVGSLFTAGLTTKLATDLTSEQAALDVDSLTPTLASSLPAELRDAVVNAYNEALTPVFLYLVPLVVLNVLVVCFLKEHPLGARSDDTPSNAARSQSAPVGEARAHGVRVLDREG